MSEATEKRHAKDRARVKAHFAKKRVAAAKKAKAAAPKFSTPAKTNTTKDGIQTFTKPGNKGWKIDTGKQKKTIKAPSKPTKTTYGLGKAGTSTVVDLGKNPTQAQFAKGKAMLPKGKKATAPQAKAPSTKRPASYDKPAIEVADLPAKTWKPVNIKAELAKNPKKPTYMMKPPKAPATPKTNEIKIPSIVKKAAAFAGGAIAALGAMKLGDKAGKAIAKVDLPTKAPQVTAAKTRKPVTTPKAPKVAKVETPKAPKTSAKVKTPALPKPERRVQAGTTGDPDRRQPRPTGDQGRRGSDAPAAPKPERRAKGITVTRPGGNRASDPAMTAAEKAGAAASTANAPGKKTSAAPKPAPKVETPKAPRVYPVSKPAHQQPKAAFEAVERADKKAKFRPPPKTPTLPKVEAPKPQATPVGASPKEVAAIEEAASRQLVGTKPKAPAEPKAAGTSGVPAPPKQAAAPKAPAWSPERRSESLLDAREARKAGNVEAMTKALENLPPDGKKSATERVHLQAGIKSAGSRPVGVVSTALTARKTRKQAKAAGKQAGKQEKAAAKDQKVTLEGGEAAELRASKEAIGKTPALPKVDTPAEPKAPKAPKAPAGPSTTVVKQAASQIEGAAAAVSAEGNSTIYKAARQAQKTGDAKAIRAALASLPKGTKKSAKLTETLNAALKSAGNRPAAPKAPAAPAAPKAPVTAPTAAAPFGSAETVAGEHRVSGERRQQKTRRGPDRMNMEQADRLLDNEPLERPVGPKRSTQRGKVQRRGTGVRALEAEFTTPAISDADKALKAKANAPADADLAKAELKKAQAGITTPALPADNKATYDAARKAQKSGSVTQIEAALKTLPAGTKKTAKLTTSLNEALAAAKTTAPGPAIGNNAVTKIDGIPEVEQPKQEKTGRTKSQDRKIKQEQRSQVKDQKKAGVTVKDPKTGLTVRPYEVPPRIAAEPLDADAARQADADNKRANERTARQASEADIAGANEGYQRGADTARGTAGDRRTAADIVGEAEVEARTTRVEPGKAAGSESADWQRGRSAAPEASIAETTVEGQTRPNADFELKLPGPGGKSVDVKLSTPSAAISTAVREVATPGEGLRLAESRATGTAQGLSGRETSMTDAAQDRRLLALEATGLLNPANETDVSTKNEAEKIVTEARETQRRNENRRKGERRTAMDNAQKAIASAGQDILGKARDDRAGTDRRGTETTFGEGRRFEDLESKGAFEKTGEAERRAEAPGETTKVQIPEMPTPRPARAESSGEGAKAVEAQADKILEDAGYRKMHDPLTETEAEERVRTRTELLEETRRASIEASEAVEMGEKQVQNREAIKKQQAERARTLPATRVGTADLPTPRTVNQGLGYVYQPHTAEMAEQTRAANLRRARIRGVVQGKAAEQRAPRQRRHPEGRRTGDRRADMGWDSWLQGEDGGRRVGTEERRIAGVEGTDPRRGADRMPSRRERTRRSFGEDSREIADFRDKDRRVENRGRPSVRTPVPNLATPEMGAMLNAPEGRPGHVPRPTSTDRRQGDFGKRIDTITPEGQATVQERYAQRQAAKVQAPLTSPAIPGSTAKTPAAPYTGTEGVTVRGTGAKVLRGGRSAAIATLIFSAIGAGDAAAKELYGGEGAGTAAKAAAKELAGSSLGVAQDLATFTAADVAVTKALPSMAEGLARKLGNAIARRTAQGSTGRAIANAILKSAGNPVITKLATVRGVAATVGKGGIIGWIAPETVEAAKTAAEYSQIPRQNRQAVEDAESNKKNMERLYGTVERATRTRKGLDPDTGKRISLDDAGAFAEDMLTEISAREERAKKLRDAQNRRPRGV